MADVWFGYLTNCAGVVVHGVRTPITPLQASCASFHMILAFGLPSPTAPDRSTSIYTTGVGRFPIIYELTDPIHPTTSRFVAASQHAEGWMVAIFFRHSDGLFHQVGVDGTTVSKCHTVVRPTRSLGLEVETHLVGCYEGCVGGAIGVETHVVQSVFLAATEYAFP